MSTGPGDSATSGAGSDFLHDWQSVRGDEAIQFTPLKEPPPPETPEWLKKLFEWLGDIFAPVGRGLGWVFEKLGLSGPAWPWIAGLVIGALIGWALWTWWPRKKRPEPAAAEESWAPDRAAALGLLADADRLASEGRFDEATHLLLQRSVSHIAQADPGLLHPSSTAREIAALPVLSDAARSGFTTIAERVERSLFALRKLDLADWQAARAAYAAFALGHGERAA